MWQKRPLGELPPDDACEVQGEYLRNIRTLQSLEIQYRSLIGERLVVKETERVLSISPISAASRVVAVLRMDSGDDSSRAASFWPTVQVPYIHSTARCLADSKASLLQLT